MSWNYFPVYTDCILRLSTPFHRPVASTWRLRESSLLSRRKKLNHPITIKSNGGLSRMNQLSTIPFITFLEYSSPRKKVSFLAATENTWLVLQRWTRNDKPHHWPSPSKIIFFIVEKDRKIVYGVGFSRATRDLLR